MITMCIVFSIELLTTVKHQPKARLVHHRVNRHRTQYILSILTPLYLLRAFRDRGDQSRARGCPQCRAQTQLDHCNLGVMCQYHCVHVCVRVHVFQCV